jgi:hypothetical protein
MGVSSRFCKQQTTAGCWVGLFTLEFSLWVGQDTGTVNNVSEKENTGTSMVQLSSLAPGVIWAEF